MVVTDVVHFLKGKYKKCTFFSYCSLVIWGMLNLFISKGRIWGDRAVNLLNLWKHFSRLIRISIYAIRFVYNIIAILVNLSDIIDTSGWILR